MIRFLEQTVSKEHSGRSKLAYGACSFFTIFFLVCGAMSASSTIGRNDAGGLQIMWLWIIVMILCLALAALCFFGRDYLRPEYDYSFTESVIDVSRVLNNKRRKHLVEFNLGKVSDCGSIRTNAFRRAKSMPGIEVNNWYIHEDAKLYYFVYEVNGRRHLIVLEFNDKMIELIRRDPTLQHGAWHEEEEEN